MYRNMVSFSNSRVMTFDTETPFSIDKLKDEWVMITDSKTKTALSFKVSEVVTIASTEVSAEPKKTRKKPAIKTAITEE